MLKTLDQTVSHVYNVVISQTQSDVRHVMEAELSRIDGDALFKAIVRTLVEEDLRKKR